MSEGNWSENGCWVGVSSTAQCHLQHFSSQWESKIGLSENNLHGFGAGVDVEVQIPKMAFFLTGKEKERLGRDLFVVRSGYQPLGTKGPVCRMCPEQNAGLFRLPPAAPPAPTPAECRRIHLGFVD